MKMAEGSRQGCFTHTRDTLLIVVMTTNDHIVMATVTVELTCTKKQTFKKNNFSLRKTISPSYTFPHIRVITFFFNIGY